MKNLYSSLYISMNFCQEQNSLDFIFLELSMSLLEQFPDCKELLDTYTDALHIEAQLECEADFERGFKLGAAIVSELCNE